MRNLSYLILFLIFFNSCHEGIHNVEYSDFLGKPAIPISLIGQETHLPITDFIADAQLDSVSTLGNGYRAELNGDFLYLYAEKKADPLGVLHFWKGENSNSVLLKKSNRKEVQFSYPSNGKVQIKGEMNAWNINDQEGKIKNGNRVFTYNINPGNYQYQFVVDGKETLDPNNSNKIDNGFGGFNSLLEIKRPNSKDLPIVATDHWDETGIYLNLKNEASRVLVFCDNELHSAWENMPKGQLLVKPPLWTHQKKRVHMRIWAFNETGASNDLLIPLEDGFPIDDVKDLNRKDWHASIMYFMMIDRFKNGKLENDNPTDDPDIHPKANHHGGDLVGIHESISDDYFEELGVNTLWLSPITQNPDDAYGLYPEPYTKFSAYHGYWPVSNSKVDHRFGTKNELDELIHNAHSNKMNVILDYVANHVHEEHPLYKDNPDWATDLYLPDSTLNTEKWDDHRLTTWFDTFMPTLDLSKEEVYQPMTDSALYWVQNAAFDGFRHDATKHIPEVFWRTLTLKVKNKIDLHKRPIFQIGETYGSRELISSYISHGQLDAQFDFNVYDDLIQVFGKEEMPMTRLQASLSESFNYYGNHNLMGYISGNQDKPRFISLASGSVKFDEDTKRAGWTRKIENDDPLAFKKLNQLQAFIMTIPGIPCLYYGDEFGSPGGNDPDNRRMMKFGDDLDKDEKETLEIAKKIIAKRNEHLALIYGDFNFLEVGDDFMMYKRKYFQDEVWVLFNKSNESKRFEIESDKKLTSLFQGQIQGASIELEAHSFEILSKDKRK